MSTTLDPRPASVPLGLGTRLDHFGPVTVTALLGCDVEVEMALGTRRWARLAIAGIYQPQAGDTVLAIAADGECYVVGVLDGRGPTVLEASGDLHIRAPNGCVQISASAGCAIEAPAIRIEAAELDLIGDTLHQCFATVRSRIREILDVRALAICVGVAQTYRLTAGRIVGRGKTSVTIEAPAIDLG